MDKSCSSFKHRQKVTCKCGKTGEFDALNRGRGRGPSFDHFVYFDQELGHLVCYRCWWVLAGVWCG